MIGWRAHCWNTILFVIPFIDVRCDCVNRALGNLVFHTRLTKATNKFLRMQAKKVNDVVYVGFCLPPPSFALIFALYGGFARRIYPFSGGTIFSSSAREAARRVF
jgi:hypothetical protein